MSIISNTFAAGAGIVVAVGTVFHDEILPPPPEPPSAVTICEDPQLRTCRSDGRPMLVIVVNSGAILTSEETP